MRLLIILGCFFLSAQNILLFISNGFNPLVPDQIALLIVTLLLLSAGIINIYLYYKKEKTKEIDE